MDLNLESMINPGSPGQWDAVSWPRISPPGLAAVWMFTYHRPALRSPIWLSVMADEPLIGLANGGVSGMATPAALPTGAGPWKWAMVGAPERPE